MIVVFFFLILFKLDYTLFFLVKSSNITVKIKGTGEQNVIFGGWGNVCYRLTNSPNEIYINGEKQTTRDYKYNFEQEENLVTFVWNFELTTCHCLFFECSSIVEVDLSKFNSSQVRSMNSMFDSCTSLTSVNFNGIVTTSVTSMEYMFFGCAFTSLDLSQFDTSNVNTMSYMFSECTSLTSLNLSSFYTSNLRDMSYMFYACTKLSYINLANAIISETANIESIIVDISKNLLICLSDEGTKILNSSIITHGCGIISCSNIYLEILESIYDDILTNEECLLLEYLKVEEKNCPNGKYLSDNNECENCYTKCSLCSKESIENDLCITCNEGYYQIYNYKSSNSYYINCFHSPDNYYLDNDFYYKECFISCKSCDKNGSELFHNCIECGDEYPYEMKILDTLNCYKYCTNYYYLDKISNKYFCTENQSCPNLYPKLIIEKNECIDNCTKDPQNQYEYKNECYNKCPENTTSSMANSFICQEIYIYYGTNINTEKINEFSTEIINDMIYKSNNHIKYKTTNDITFISTNDITDKITNDITDKITNDITDKITNDITDKITNDILYITTNGIIYKTSIKSNSEAISGQEKEEIKYITENNIKPNLDNNNYSQNIYDLYFTANYYSNIINNKLNLSKIYSEDKDELLRNIKEYIMEEFDKSELDKGNHFEFQGKEILITLRTVNEQKKFINNETSIDLENCELILKEEYNISKNTTLYILKIEIEIKGMKIPKTEYEIYYFPFNGLDQIKLNLTKCKNENIVLFNKVLINNPLEHYDSKSNYYNDICSKSKTEYDTDISLKDRRNNFIENNMTLCEENCELIDYDYTNERAKCSCKIKLDLSLVNNIKFDKEELKKNFVEIKNIANIQFLKCYKITFIKDEIKNNLGCFIFMFIIFLYFICLILFYCKHYDLLKIEINMIISKIKSEQKQNNQRKENKNGKKNIIKKSQKNKRVNKQKNSINKNKTRKKILLNNISDNNFPPKKKKGRMKNKRNINQMETLKNENKKIKSNNDSKLRILNNKNKQLDYTDYELNKLDYKSAKIYDKRTYCQYYFSLVKMNQLFLFSFCPNKDYNSRIIKIFLFFFFFGVNFTINTLFFTDSTIHKIYKDKGIYNISYQIPQIFYSSIITMIISTIIKFLSLSQDNIIKLKNIYNSDYKEDYSKKIFNILNIKFLLSFLFSLIFLLIFWYYNTSFCGIYQNTQIQLIKDTIISFGFSLILPFIKGLIPGIMRIPSLRSNHNEELLYKFSKFFQIFS